MSDFDVAPGVFEDFAKQINEEAIAKQNADKAAAIEPYTANEDLGKILGLPDNPLDPSSASLPYEQGSYAYNGKYGQPVWGDGKIIGYEFVGQGKTPGMQEVTRTDVSGNISQSYEMPEGENQDILGTILKFAPVLLAAVPGAGLALGQSILGAGASNATATAIGNAFINGTISEARGGNFLEGAALSYAGSAIPNLDAVKGGASYLSEIDPTGTLSRAATGAVTSGAKALITNQDVGSAMLSGAASGGMSGAVNALTSNIEGFGDLTPAQQAVVNNSVASVISGRPLDQVAINAAISTAKNEMQSLGAGPNKIDFESGSFKYGQAFDPATAGMVDLSEKPADQNYQFTTDFGVGADYGLGPKSDGQGFQVTAPPDVFNKDGSVNYDLLDYGRLSQLGMDMPKTSNLDSMGGGQGLRIPVQGGYITEQGFTPEGYTPDLGDKSSFINQPAPGARVPGAAVSPKAAPKTSPSGVDLKALMSLLVGAQATPMMVSSGQDNSADIELMQDIFGTSLSAPPAGNTDTQSSALARLLRS